VIVINPVGYLGGGGDDYEYLQAARCWVANGPCVPETHWASRWPIVAPVAQVLALFGESRTTAAIAPLLWWLSGVAGVAVLGARWFGAKAGVIAANLFVVLPVYAVTALSIGADVPEVTLQLWSLVLASEAWRKQSRRWAVAAGALAAVSFATRETSVAFLGAAAIAWLALDRHRRSVLLWALPGFVAVVAAELAAYWVVTGDVFYRTALSFRHASMFTSELAASVDRSRSPLFNPEFIAGWKREMGIELFWPVDPWLNLLATPRLGATLIAAAAATLLWRQYLSAAEQRRCALLTVGALLAASALIYGLAVDPKSRMFMGLAAAAALVLGAALAAAWERGRALPVLLVAGVLVIFQLSIHSEAINRFEAERAARAWIAAHPAQIEMDPSAVSYLALVPQASALPRSGSGRPLVLAVTSSTCASMISGSSRTRPIGGEPSAQAGRGGLCLFRY
jgi:4-amino-4-deoxy-L-arabinose transferase-like glycosyltransferase